MRTVVVTGGGTGIGREIAAGFASDGCDVVITGRRGDVLERAAKEIEGAVRAITLDGTDPEQTAAVARAVGAVDVLVNNAGGNTDFDHPAPGNLGEVAEAWRRNLDSNLLTAVLMTTALLPAMPSGSSVITIGSIAADKGAGSYGAAKAAVASWNVDLARRVGAEGITANIVSPGYVADTEFFRDNLTDERRAALLDAAMTKRAGAPADIAATVRFLASPGARQITGQTVAVNGGEWTTR
ncbi:3-oxoacyl-ACP reductase [Nocardia neocaledoniensis NBRC 108232]|uniref:3-oxoacyl-[acyl-carrier protein] reductase n=1 Tax=Nocardia neocaledoniensis TaxID=236511 RepID=A0A317NW14_9NOCA|nr:SDR family oxidoreductase [Nocardia neocaledoniensis]PWV79530.1 3-oxoacyl-[acyl-carrier protein] reductase [Nocardia neocaledoniensis]GEM30091.1 3-oxoacyl-ACP reductase [Nocardia neocaledoniensis NBRC 108232]